ncbi:MAG: chlorophyll synthesis pathway protein BchC [Pseudomonadota bacterium]
MPQPRTTQAIVLEGPEQLRLSPLPLDAPASDDLVVDIEWSGISTGTERLLWNGTMPSFPGMGYPLVPGYESVGRVVDAGADASHRIGDHVFVPGARCYGDVRGLFGGAASQVVVPSKRAPSIGDGLGEDAVLLALAATAYHALAASQTKQPNAELPDLIVGHGVLGRLLARLAVALGDQAPTVWETNPVRSAGATGYQVIDPKSDERSDYRAIYDVSGDADLLDTLIARLGKGGEIVLAGFYHAPLKFAFPPAFMCEARLRVAAEWQPDDMAAVLQLVAEGRLSLADLITHTVPAVSADRAYRTAFEDPACLKMVLDWRSVS